MIEEKKDQGWYCTRCQKTYAHYVNIPIECFKGTCRRK